MKKYIVRTGIVAFTIEAVSFREAIGILKQKFSDALEEPFFYAPRWGFSYCLAEAHAKETLNYLVFDENMTDIVGGELNGEIQDIPTMELVEQFSYFISENLMRQHKQKIHRG